MKKIIIVLFFYLASCSSGTKWYAGGTLHNSKKSEWVKATKENQLATCADFVANIKKANNQTYDNLDEMKTDATNMMDCINAALPAAGENQSISEMAVMCHIVQK